MFHVTYKCDFTPVLTKKNGDFNTKYKNNNNVRDCKCTLLYEM